MHLPNRLPTTNHQPPTTNLLIFSCCKVLMYDTRFQSMNLLKSGCERGMERTVGRGGSEFIQSCLLSSMKPVKEDGQRIVECS